jgi:hypothetical protein
MNKDLKNIDKLFLNNLHGLQDMPPARTWDEIAEALDNTPLPAATKPNQTAKSYYLAAALLLLIGGTTAFFTWSSGHSDDHNASEVIVAKAFVEPLNKTASITKQNQDRATVQPSAAINNVPQKQEALKNEPSVMGVDEISEVIPVYRKQAVEETIPVSAQSIMATPITTPLMIESASHHALSNIASANKSTIKNTKKLDLHNKFSVAVFFAPDITTRNLEQDKNGSPGGDKDEISRTERNNALDYTIGAKIEYALNKHFSLQSGISFSSNTIDISPKTIYAGYDVDGTVKYRYNCSSGYAFFNPKSTAAAPLAVGDSTQALSSTTVLHYVNIPVAVKYNFSMGQRLNLFVQAGITARLITKHSIDAVYAIGATKENTIGQIQGLKRSYFNGVVGLGADYSISPHLAITLSPTFNFATTAINRNSPVKAYPNTVSIATGIKFNF